MVMAGPHRRHNPLTDEWVLVSAGRTDRPWQGITENPPPNHRPHYDPTCYLCPGNTRANGDTNPGYGQTFVFDNDFSALQLDTPSQVLADGLIRAESEAGTCRVICYSPRHDLDLASLPPSEIRAVVELWAAQIEELSVDHRWVQVFENRGAAMGASNPHPHGQVWAGSALPDEPRMEDSNQRRYYEGRGSTMLMDYLSQEIVGDRIVTFNDTWVALVPYWAVWPFEMLVLPRRHVSSMPATSPEERDGLADVLADFLGRYDQVFDQPFPYSMGWHGAPSPVDAHPHWQLHAHFYPPLLQSASLRKHMVGYELLAEKQRDITAETVAARLRELARADSDA